MNILSQNQYRPIFDTPLSEKIEANLNEIADILRKIEALPARKRDPKLPSLVFLAWIHIWETMRLLSYSSVGEVRKNSWIDKITRAQQEIVAKARYHRRIRCGNGAWPEWKISVGPIR